MIRQTLHGPHPTRSTAWSSLSGLVDSATVQEMPIPRSSGKLGKPVMTAFGPMVSANVFKAPALALMLEAIAPR